MSNPHDTALRAVSKAVYVADLVLKARQSVTISELVMLTMQAEQAGRAPVEVFSPDGGVDEKAFTTWQDSLHAKGEVVRGP